MPTSAKPNGAVAGPTIRSVDDQREQMIADDDRRWMRNLTLFAFCVAVGITFIFVLAWFK